VRLEIKQYAHCKGNPSADRGCRPTELIDPAAIWARDAHTARLRSRSVA
jgi:hypothetical protein